MVSENYEILIHELNNGCRVPIYHSLQLKVPLNSLYSPEKESTKFFKKIIKGDKEVIILIGVGNGTIVQEILNSYNDNLVHVFIIEPLEKNILSKQTKQLLHSHKDKITFSNLSNLNSIVISSLISRYASLPISIHMHPNYEKLDQYYIRKCIDLIKQGRDTREIMNNSEEFFLTDWIMEPLRNVKSLRNSFNLKDLKNYFKGETACLVAGGPSLSKNLDFLKKVSSDTYIFSVGAALRVLLKQNIEPDFVLSIDSSIRNYEAHFKDLKYKGCLIYESLSNSTIVSSTKNKKLVSLSLIDGITELFTRELISFTHPSPSVSVFTLQVIEYLGFDKLILVGQDLALVNGEYYSKGIKNHDGVKKIKMDRMVENNQGELIGTTDSLRIFHDTFEEILEKFSDIHVYNLSENGAKIKGAEYIDKDVMYSLIEKSEKKKINFEKMSQVNMNTLYTESEFIHSMEFLTSNTESALKRINRFLKVNVISAEDMRRVLKDFRKVSESDILEPVFLIRLSHQFKKIVNKFQYFEEKESYTNNDRVMLIRELKEFYSLVEYISNKVTEDSRWKELLRVNLKWRN